MLKWSPASQKYLIEPFTIQNNYTKVPSVKINNEFKAQIYPQTQFSLEKYQCWKWCLIWIPCSMAINFNLSKKCLVVCIMFLHHFGGWFTILVPLLEHSCYLYTSNFCSVCLLTFLLHYSLLLLLCLHVLSKPDVGFPFVMASLPSKYLLFIWVIYL